MMSHLLTGWSVADPGEIVTGSMASIRLLDVTLNIPDNFRVCSRGC